MFAIVLPCYNEKERLSDKSDYWQALLHRQDLHLIFVDDASDDGTFNYLLEIQKQSSRSFEVIHLEKRSGKSEAVRVGLLKAVENSYDYLGYCDADFPVDLKEFMEFIAAAKLTSADVLAGQRNHRQRMSQRGVPGFIFARLAKLLFHLPVADPQCGLKIFKNTPLFKSQLEKKFATKWLFDIELLMRLKNAKVSNFELKTWQDVPGSKMNLARWPGFALETLKVFYLSLIT